MKTAEELKEAQTSALTANAPGFGASPMRSLVDEIMFEMRGLSDVECRKELQRTAREFCERTNCWTADALFGPCTPVGAYPVANVPAGAIVVRVREKGGSWFGPGLFGWSGFPGPQPFYYPTRLVPYAGPPPPGRFVVALAPDIGSEDVPQEVLRVWGAAIVSGAKAHLMALSGREWSDPQSAVIYGQKYNAAAGEARRASELAGVPSHLQTRSKIPFVI